MKRIVLVVLLALGGAAGTTSCGGRDDSPADRVTEPIDKARDTADVANQREQQLESNVSDP